MSDSIRKITMFPTDLWAQISDWRWKHKLNTEADSIRNLIAAGLHYYDLLEDPAFRQAERDATERLQNAGS
jgi:hypothetical protein